MDQETIRILAEVLIGGGGLLALFRFFRDRKKDSYLTESVRLTNDEKRVQGAYESEQKAIARANEAVKAYEDLRKVLVAEREARFEEQETAQEAEQVLKDTLAELRRKLRELGVEL